MLDETFDLLDIPVGDIPADEGDRFDSIAITLGEADALDGEARPEPSLAATPFFIEFDEPPRLDPERSGLIWELPPAVAEWAVRWRAPLVSLAFHLLPVVAIIFLLYAYLPFVGVFLPDPWGHRGYDIARLIGHLYITEEGIFGIPLDVAATFIILFTIYGAVLEYSGAGSFFIDFSFAAMGRKRSGAGRTVTLASFLLGTVSGSGVATTVTLGSIAYPMMRRSGYDPDSDTGRIFSYDVTGGCYEERDHHGVGSGSLFARGALKKLWRPGLDATGAVRVALEALYDAADDDSATGGPDLGRRIWPVVATIDADGFRRIGDPELSALIEAMVADRVGNPGGNPDLTGGSRTEAGS